MSDRYAIVSGGSVVDVALWDGTTDWPLNSGESAIRSDVADIGWSFSNGQFTAPKAPSPPEPTDKERAEIIAARRYLAEIAGIILNGMPLDTGRDSQALVTGAALAAVIDPAYTCQWKTVEGFIDLDSQQIIAIASAMRAHVQACFDREAALLDALAAGTYTADQLDQGWPA